LARVVAELGGRLRLLVNNAGGGRGMDPGASGSVEDWQWMYEVNVLGSLRVTQALLPALEAGGAGTIVTIGSTAAFTVYGGGRGIHGAQDRGGCPGRHGAAGAARQADPGGGDRPRHGADRGVLAQ